MNLINITKYLFYGFIFFLPFQINILLYQEKWGRGLYNPYLSIEFSLSEFCLISAAACFLVSVLMRKRKIQIPREKADIFMLLLFVFIEISLFGSEVLDTYKFLLSIKVIELFIIYTMIRSKIITMEELAKVIGITVLIQVIIAIFQFILQSSLGLHLIGETIINKTDPKIAHFDFLNLNLIRAYGSFPHSNIFAGFCLFAYILNQFYKKKPFNFGIIFILGILLSFSRLHIVLLILVIILSANFRYKTWIIATGFIILGFRLINFIDDQSIMEHLMGYKNSINLFLSDPMGVGFSQYTNSLDTLGNSMSPWDYQPVHNIFLLILSESGIIAFISILCLLFTLIQQVIKNYKLQNNQTVLYILTALITIGSFDHYLFSLDQGRFLVIILLAISVNDLFNKEVLIHKNSDVQLEN